MSGTPPVVRRPVIQAPHPTPTQPSLDEARLATEKPTGNPPMASIVPLAGSTAPPAMTAQPAGTAVMPKHGSSVQGHHLTGQHALPPSAAGAVPALHAFPAYNNVVGASPFLAQRRPSFEFPLAAITTIAKRPAALTQFTATPIQTLMAAGPALPPSLHSFAPKDAKDAKKDGDTSPKKQSAPPLLVHLKQEMEAMLGNAQKRMKELTDAIRLAERNAKDEKHWERRLSMSSTSTSVDQVPPSAHPSVMSGMPGAAHFMRRSSVSAANASAVNNKSRFENQITRREVDDGMEGEDSNQRKRKRIADDAEEADVEVVPPPNQPKNKPKKGSNEDKTKEVKVAEEPKTLIPPALEGVDYSEIKVGQQTPIANFWQWVEPWLRDLNVDDLNHLRKKMKEQRPELYIVPPLGRYYLDQWAIEDTLHMPIDDHAHPISLRDSDPVLADIAIVPPEQYCGPLTERILNAMMDEPSKTVSPQGSEEMDAGDVFTSTDLILDRKKEDIMSLEERVKREIAYIGLLDDDPSLHASEDDEIARELRRLQEEHRQLSERNRQKRQKLFTEATKWMAYQDYRQVMDDIDKNIESYYNKRFAKAGKKKKKGQAMKEPASTSTTASAAQPMTPAKPVMDHVIKAIQCRKDIMSSLKHVFPKESF